MKYLLILFVLSCYTLKTYSQDISFVKEKESFISEPNKYFNQCHASTLEETINGQLLASWFGGSHEGNKDVVIWGSIFDNETWSQPNIWADGWLDNVQYPCWNPVLFRQKGKKEIFLYYKIGPNPREWWGMVKISNDNGKTWSSPSKLPKGILGPIKNKPIELSNNEIISPSSIELSENRWVSHVEKSTDNQKTWKSFPIDHNSKYNVIQPSLLMHSNGHLQVLCRSKEGKVISSFSTNNGINWTPLTSTNLVNPNSAIDAIAYKDMFLIVYNPDIPGKDWWQGRSKLRLAISKDGINWKDITTLENEDTGEFSYPTIFKDSNDKIHITYTYNRKAIKHIILKN